MKRISFFVCLLGLLTLSCFSVVAKNNESAVKPLLVFVAIEDHELRASVMAAIEKGGHKTSDVFEVWWHFNGISALTTGNIDIPRPSFWPSELGSVWDEGIKSCLAQAGKAPYGPKNHGAFICGRRLAAALWQRWLDFKKPDLFIEFETNKNPQGQVVLLRSTACRPDDVVFRIMTNENVTPASIGSDATQLAMALLAGGKGTTRPREISRELPRAPEAGGAQVGGEFLGEVMDLPAVAIPVDCKVDFPSLTIEPAAAPLAQTMIKQWNLSTAGQKHSQVVWPCVLKVAEQGKVAEGSMMMSFRGILTCNQQTFDKVCAHIKETACHKGFSTGIIEKLLQYQCKTQ